MRRSLYNFALQLQTTADHQVVGPIVDIAFSAVGDRSAPLRDDAERKPSDLVPSWPCGLGEPVDGQPRPQTDIGASPRGASGQLVDEVIRRDVVLDGICGGNRRY